jgi:DNA-binding NarL/FixJ family response regulator
VGYVRDEGSGVSSETPEDLLLKGREALQKADWDGAREQFARALAIEETGEGLDGLSTAAHFLGDFREAIELKEQTFAAYRNEGNRLGAAEAARWLAFLYGAVRGNRSAANGWVRLAERALDGVEESVEHGRLALDRAPWTDDPAEREGHAQRALEIARRVGDRDLEFSAQAVLGHAYVVAGRVNEGMTLIDEAMAAVAAGEVTGVEEIGSIYCRLLGACERANDISRAEQWISAAERFVAWGDFVAPTCRLHFGGILMATGRWEEAESELLAATRAFEDGYRGMRAAPLARLADLRVRQGRLEEAERLLEGNECRPAARQVLAAIALARGELELARELAGLCLEASDPTSPTCAPILELIADVSIAAGDFQSARQAIESLGDLAAASPEGRIAAAHELASGRLLAADGADDATALLQAAVERYAGLELPLEAARAQLDLASAIASERPAAAAAESRHARETFERLGAARDADRAAALMRDLGERSGRTGRTAAGPLTPRESEVLSLLAEGCSNAAIAERLFISRRTAEHHVASILSKLDLHSRGEAAAYAVREGVTAPRA